MTTRTALTDEMTYEQAQAKCAEMNAAFLRNDNGGEYTVFLAAQALREQITNAGWKMTHDRRGLFTVTPDEARQ